MTTVSPKRIWSYAMFVALLIVGLSPWIQDHLLFSWWWGKNQFLLGMVLTALVSVWSYDPVTIEIYTSKFSVKATTLFAVILIVFNGLGSFWKSLGGAIVTAITNGVQTMSKGSIYAIYVGTFVLLIAGVIWLVRKFRTP